MNYSTAIFLINDNVRALYVRYEVGDRTQRYMVKTFDQGIVVDDYLVVPQTGKYNMAIAKVTDVDVDVDFDSMTFVPWVLQKLDFSPFNEIIRQEDVAIAAIKEARFEERRNELASALMKSRKVKALPLVTRKGKPNG
jgi:hypothetical protein